MQEESYLPNSKNSEKLPHYRKFVVTNCVKISRFYSVLTIHQHSKHNSKRSVFKQQHIDLQNKHGKGYTWHFVELKDRKHVSE